MAGRHLIGRLVAGAAALVTGAGVITAVTGAGLVTAPVAGPVRAAGPAGAPGTVPAGVSAAAESPDGAVTVRIDPSYQQQPFEGWGTSLVWFANITGGYPDEIRTKLVDLVFGTDGLNLNIARYNIGGGNAPDVRTDYMKLGATMPGFWKAPAGTTRTDLDWWDPDNPEHWNWDADANQRWWVDQIKDKVDRWEAFSNSPPWFQTVSGYVSGGFDPSADQIRADRVDDFATYLVRVAERLEQAHGITFDTIDPLNEPNTPFWGTTLGPDGQPVGGRQEGAHAGPALQQQVVRALRRALDAEPADPTAGTGATDAVVSAMDETNPGIFTQDWNAYDSTARAAVDQLNVHTYGTGMRTSARDLAKGADKKLWMSEVEGTWGTGTSFTSMEPGLGIATRIVDDLRELEPSAWVLWQPIEDAIPQAAGGGNWGSIHIPFNCGPDATLATCPIQTNTKFHTIRNFTHYIRPGDRLVAVDEPASIAAVASSGRAATVVHVNNGTSGQSVTLDLSRFGQVWPRATVTPVVSSAQGGLVRGAPVRVTGRSATLAVPGKSVTTFLVDGVSGVARDAALVQPGHVYRLRGAQSGRSLAPAPGATGVVIRTDAAAADQLWSVRKLAADSGSAGAAAVTAGSAGAVAGTAGSAGAAAGGPTNRERYAVVNAGNGKRLAVRGGTAVLEDAPAGDRQPVDESAQWILSTTGDGTWTLVNAGTGRLLDVSGQATVDGSPVSVFTPTSGANQRWAVVDETVQGTEPVQAYTVPGMAPALPATVTGVYRDGARGNLPVRWALPGQDRWREPGTVRVPGEATDPLGRVIGAEAVVAVDTFAATLPARAKAYAGGPADLPATVVGAGAHGGRADLPVTWEPVPPGAFDQPGVVTLHGVARVVDGSTPEATVRVQVTAPVPVNAARDAGVAASATFTESGYSPDGLRNGNLADKAWSNWRPDAKNPSDTITLTLPAARDLTRVVTYFFRDGSNISFADHLKVQVQAGDGQWVDASGEVTVGTEGSPVVDVPVAPGTAAGPVSAVRVVMTARPSGYITLSEIEVYARAPGVSADAAAASIGVDGVPVAGFAPDTTSYRVVTPHPRRGVVTATPRDPYASVRVGRDGRSDRVLVTVTSEDTSQTRQYRVELVPR